MNTILLKIAFRNRKKLTIYIIIIASIIIILNILISFSFNISSSINKEILQKTSNRQIYVELDHTQSEYYLKTIINNNYNKIIDFFYPITISSEILGETRINKYVEGEFKIIEGRNPNYESKNEIMIPDRVKLNGNIINTAPLLNKEILLNIQTKNSIQEYKFLIVGIYQQNQVSVINDSYITANIKNDDNKERYIIILNEASKKNEIISRLINNEITAKDYDDSTYSEYNIYYKYKTIINSFVYVSVILLIVLYNLIISKILREHDKILAIMRIYGYKKRIIRNNISICFLTLINLAYFFSLLLKIVIEKYLLSIKINIIPSLITYSVIIGVVLIIILINLLKLENKNLSKLINNN